MATLDDVVEGRATFSMPKNKKDKARLIDMKLPCCAIYTDPQTKTELTVIIIQTESFRELKMAGYRFIRSGSGIAELSNFEILSGPDHRFKKKK